MNDIPLEEVHILRVFRSSVSLLNFLIQNIRKCSHNKIRKLINLSINMIVLNIYS